LLVEYVALFGRNFRQGRNLLRIADDGGDLMAAPAEFGEQARADHAGGADQGDIHIVLRS
jgi:hypothetical protein